METSRRKFLFASSLILAPRLFNGKFRTARHPARTKSSEGPVQETWIELNLPNMSSNLEKIRHRVRVPVMAVIKANAYGHGLKEVGRFLDQHGIDALMVCKLSEAIELRESGVNCPILNFGPLFPEDAEFLIKHKISQSVFTEDIRLLSQKAQKAGTKIDVHIHIDTGMGRMGIPYPEAESYIQKTAALEGIAINGISTTMTEHPAFDKVQMKRFLAICKNTEHLGIRTGLKHAFSSAGLFTAGPSFLDMVRPGILLYGYYPNEQTQKEDLLSLRPVLQLKSRVAAVKILRPGDSVSYHRAYRVKKAEKMAVIPVGYSDGYPFHAAGKGWVLIRGQKHPVIGGVTANHLEARLPLESPVSLGDEVVLLGTQGGFEVTADHWAEWEGISNYKILLRLNPLLPRMQSDPNSG